MISAQWRLWIVVLGSFLLFGRSAVSAESLTVQQWREDLNTFVEKAPKIHKNLFHSLRREEFEAAVQGLSARVPTLSRNQIIVELARIMAKVGDGHSYIPLIASPVSFRRYPIKLYEFPDGVYVVAADPKYKAVVGGRVVELGKTPFDRAYRAISEIVARDNAMQVKEVAPNYASIAEVLDGLGLADDVENLTLTVIKDGKRVKARLSPGAPGKTRFYPWGTEAGWEDARAAGVPTPLWLQAPEDAYWFKYLPEEKILYVQFNEVSNKADETLEAFFKRAMAFAEANPVERFVLDIRLNGGGNNYLNRPIIHGFIRSDKFNQPGRLFTIVGRQTFSAAMNFTNAMKLNTKTLFVGEPTGARPNMYGDNVPLILPNSRIAIRLSTLWWQDMDPRDDREHQAPDLAADLTIADYRAGRDPALEVIKRYDPRQSPLQTIRSALSRRDWAAARAAVVAHKTNPLYRYASLEEPLGMLGDELLGKKSFDEAIEVFKLNVETYPDSWNAYENLAEAYAARRDVAKGDLRLAEQNYQKSLQLNPHNARTIAALDELKQR
jgi:tetratricopeptide (TPR) repeat protein